MVDTPSRMLPLGTPLPLAQPGPQQRLIDVANGKPVDVGAVVKGKAGTLVMFICNHCPFVVHIRRELVLAAHEAIDRGLAVLAINSNDTESHPQDGPDAMRRLATEEGWRFPFLFDETQDVARAFDAQCTPDLYLFDASQRLVYRGQFDDSRPRNGKPVTGRDLRAAIDAVASGRTPSASQTPSVGCNIKWRAGSGARPRPVS
jgi:hypothetical protein